MNKQEIILSYYQVMIFAKGLSDIKRANPHFEDGISLCFEQYVLKRAQEIALTPDIVLKLIPSKSKYKISDSMFRYLINLTGLNPFDPEVYNQYLPIIEEETEQRIKEFIGGSKIM